MSARADEAALDLRLALAYPGFALDVQAVLPGRGVSALFGPSGCGKTSVLRALAGLARARGRVALGDEVWQDDARGLFVPPHRRAIGYVFQEAALFPHLSVRRNLLYGWRRVAPAKRKVALEQAVELLGISHLLERAPATLSGGERQRVAIARALLTSPRLLLMDEPLAALDAPRKAEILPYLEHLHAELAMPVVYVTHAMDEVVRLADHLVLMADGRVRASGPLVETMARTDLPLGAEAGAVFDGTVGERDTPWQLVRLDVGGGSGCPDPGAPGAGFSLWARDHGLPVGARVRLRVLARDVSLARMPQASTSIANQLRGTVESLGEDDHPALALVCVRVGAHRLLARLSRRSAHALQLAPGMPVWAQVKTVALLERAAAD